MTWDNGFRRAKGLALSGTLAALGKATVSRGGLNGALDVSLDRR